MINPMEMTGRTVLVTGASSGLGRETAILLSQLGAKVALVARNKERLEATLQQLTGTGHSLWEKDLGKDLDSIPKWMKQVCETTGPLQGLVHGAGIISMLPLRVLTLAKLNEIMQVNFESAAMLAKGFRQRGVVQSPGSIVMLASIAGLMGQRGLAAYSASKGALIALTRCLSLELAEEGIRINSLAPGLVKTEMFNKHDTDWSNEKFEKLVTGHPLGLGEPRDVANAVAFLLADTARWITGSTLVIDGGYSINGA